MRWARPRPPRHDRALAATLASAARAHVERAFSSARVVGASKTSIARWRQQPPAAPGDSCLKRHVRAARRARFAWRL